MRVRKKFIIDYIKFLKIRNVFSINYKTEFEFVSLKENEDITTQMEIFFFHGKTIYVCQRGTKRN